MAYLEKHLYLKRSGVPGAGKGLFTKVPIKKGTRIVEYKGRIRAWKDVKHLDGYNGYLFRINSRVTIDAEPYIHTFGRYANDAKGFGRKEGLKNNAEYNTSGNKCYIDAIRDIPRYGEILVEYGGNFWKLFRMLRKKQQSGKKSRRKS